MPPSLLNMTNPMLTPSTVFILQGISGSGKSTLAATLAPKERICSADDYFMQDGKYVFDGVKLPLAHAECLRKYVSLLTSTESCIVVDNTNTTVAELAPYYALAQAYGREVFIVTVPCDPAVAAERNSHGVPLKACEAMAARIAATAKQLPPWWKRVSFDELPVTQAA